MVNIGNFSCFSCFDAEYKFGNLKNYLRFQGIFPYICTVDQKDKNINRILEVGKELFLQRGFSSVSMDDLASEIGMSKKTIYKYFSSKSTLVEVLVNTQLESDQEVIQKIIDTAKDPIFAMVAISRLIYAHFKEMSPGILMDLKKNYYDIWLVIDDMQNDFMLREITQNIEKGMDLGLYRIDIAPAFCANLYVENIKSSCENPSYFVGMERYYMMLIKYHMHGIMSEKGRKLFKDYNAQIAQKEN